MDVQKRGRLFLVLGSEKTSWLEVSIEHVSRNKAIGVEPLGRTPTVKKPSKDRSGEVIKDGTCMKDSL